MTFSQADLEQMAGLGIAAEEAERQLQFFASSPAPLRIVRPCRQGDGIERLAPERHDRLLAAWAEAARGGRLLKFVPASGAASRMFGVLERFLDRVGGPGSGGPEADEELHALIEGLHRLPFFSELRRAVEEAGDDLEALLDRQDYPALIRHLLDPAGLGLRERPKGLIGFHLYPSGARTAFEEHLVEGRGYLADRQGRCRFHFTVAPEHRPAFEAALEQARGRGEAALDEVSFSVQSPATHTIAVDEANRPFRSDDGQLLFWPSGHGALIENLSQLQGDLVFIKNIDNIAPERFHPTTVHWKKLLAGYLVELQQKIYDLLEALERQGKESPVLDEAFRFAETGLAVWAPEEVRSADPEPRRRYLVDRLDRPLRVCGVVRNEAEPGGGPFWLEEGDAGQSGQIVEPGQVDRTSPEQLAIWRSSTHFNPVDLVCALRDRHGNPYDLHRFVDSSTAFVSEKTHGGRKLKALERPGLWNGAMAGWNTVFVEVPPETFTPVKTVLDLLRPEHQV
ncbi:MAG: DUF4301 family protein [Thermoanaerobaculia bacterium]